MLYDMHDLILNTAVCDLCWCKGL